MDRTELAYRLRQEFQKRADSVLFRLSIDPSLTETRRTVVSPRNFFFHPEDIAGRMNVIRERMPQQVATILRRAEKISQHRFDLLGCEDLDYGPEIDWHCDRVSGKRAPRDLWFKIRYLDFSSVGDAKVTWELNRHQHLVTLAKAYRFTEDPRFVRELMAQWGHWQRENPYPWGINWASSLEVAFRSLSWLWIYFLLEGTTAMPPEFREEWLHMLALSGRHIERYLSKYFSPNTHLLGEAVALFFIGTLCPELRSASRWKQQGWETVLRESERQIRPDGFYFEQSTYYHVYALDFLTHAYLLARLNDVPFPPEYARRLEQMLDVLAILCRAGAPPRWGDDDGGRVSDQLRNHAQDLSDPLATGAILFGRGDFKWIAGGLREETLWLLGEKGAAEFDRIEATQPEMNSIVLPDSGLYVMSTSGRGLQAVMDAGPQGALRAGHGHADALSLTLHVDGHEILGDAGTYVYASDGKDRDQFRGTSAHNTLQFDGRNQSEPDGPFAWQHLVNAKAERWVTGETFDLFVGSHDGYSLPGNPQIHRRWVFFRKPKFWLVRDLMLGTGKHQVELRWHLHPELSPGKQTEDPFFRSGGNSGIAIFSPEGHSWSKTVDQGIWSAAYGSKQSATEVRFTTAATLPAEFAVLLAPTSELPEGGNVCGRLSQFFPSAGVSVYRFTNESEEHEFVFADKKSWIFGEWKGDAEFLYSERTRGKLNLLIFFNASEVEFRGNKILSSPKRVVRCETFYSGGKLCVDCPGEELLLSNEALHKSFEARETVSQASDERDR